MKRILAALIVLLSGFSFSCSLTGRTPPQGVILFIGDGMGFEHVKAASLYASGGEGSLSFEQFSFQGETSTRSADNDITDSAAGATAMATGIKVNNGVISISRPGDGMPLTTLVEEAEAEGMFTAVLSTTFVTHATPAAFLAHVENRNMYEEIGLQIFEGTKPDIILGGGGNGVSADLAAAAGYTVARTASELLAFNPANGMDGMLLSGQFGDTHIPYAFDGLGAMPSLTDMLVKALDLAVSNNVNGFFIVAEGGRIDHASHGNDLLRCVFETLGFADAVQIARDRVAVYPSLSLVVTADHETGGLMVLAGNGAGILPDASWSTDYHTGVNVPVYGYGKGTESINGKVIDNTDIYAIVRGILFQ